MSRDAATELLSKEIAEARVAILASASEDQERWWFAYELKDQARNGWSAGAMNIALNRLIDSGAFEIKGDLIRLRR